ncbi:hypothetical protein D3C75_1034030 [compost metagenome]
MLFLAVCQVVTFTVDDRTSSHHFGVQQRFLAQQAMEITAMAIGPVQHRGNGETIGGVLSVVNIFRHAELLAT